MPALSQFLECHILCLQLGVILFFRVEGLASAFVQRMEICGHVYHILGSHFIDFRNDFFNAGLSVTVQNVLKSSNDVGVFFYNKANPSSTLAVEGVITIL